MAKHVSLPTDRILSLDIDRLLSVNRVLFGDATMTQPDPPSPPAPPAPAPPAPAPAPPTPPAPPAPPAPAPAPEDTGFPPNTPLERMTGDQREAYWRHHARKHEERVKALGVTPEELTALRDKATKHDQLERELMSDKDKAVAEAADKAKADALNAVTPKLVRAEFKAALTGRVPTEQLEERLTATVDALDLSKFLTATGDVDTAKVTAFVDGIAPVTGTGSGRKGPSATGHGSGTGSGSGSGSTALTGRELFEQRHKKTSTSA